MLGNLIRSLWASWTAPREPQPVSPSQTELSGLHYMDILSRVHSHIRPGSYVEIGVSRGKSLRLVAPATRTIGIDPEPRVAAPQPPNVTIYAKTSDAFFAEHDLAAELGGRKVDLAFIDGMHLFEYALRDFMNIESYCTRNSTVLIHDCYPLDEESSTRERRTVDWTGDVWRAIVALRAYRPDLSICTLASPPSGLAMIRNLDPRSTLLRDRFDSIVAEFSRRSYGTIGRNKAEMLNLVAADWPAIALRLG